MKKIVWILLMLMPLSLAGQTNNNRKWEIGVDLLPLFDKNDFSNDYWIGTYPYENHETIDILMKGLTLLGRYKFTAREKTQWAIRGHLGYNYVNFNEKVDAVITTDSFGTRIYRHRMYTGFGVERRKLLSNQFTFYYGSDVVYWAFREKTPRLWNGVEVANFITSTNTFELNGFVGIQYNFTKRFGMIIESNITGFHSNTNHRKLYSNPPPGIWVLGRSYGMQTTQGIRMNTLSKLSFIYVL
jgi:hypothetical protein